MNEEEYDALTEEEKIVFDRQVWQLLRERKKRWAPRAGRNRSCSWEELVRRPGLAWCIFSSWSQLGGEQ
jgi:hypothetical protein